MISPNPELRLTWWWGNRGRGPGSQDLNSSVIRKGEVDTVQLHLQLELQLQKVRGLGVCVVLQPVLLCVEHFPHSQLRVGTLTGLGFFYQTRLGLNSRVDFLQDW